MEATRVADIDADGDGVLDDYGVSDGRWLTIDWREHLHWAEVDAPGGRTTVNYVDIGSGPPVMFVHGLGGSWRNWLENIPRFSDSHRVIALDLPGFGDSPNPPWDIEIASYGEFVHAFADHLGLNSDLPLVGHSMGGFISTEAVIASPERFSKLVLVSAAGITYAKWRKEPATVLGRVTKQMAPRVATRFERDTRRRRIRRMFYAGVITHPSRMRPEILYELGRGALNAAALGEGIAALTGYDTRERLPEIELPTMIVWGRKDRLVPVAAAYAYERRIPDSKLELLADTGHMVQLERPARFNRIVSGFIPG